MSQPKINPATGYVHYEEPERGGMALAAASVAIAAFAITAHVAPVEQDIEGIAASEPETTEDPA